MQFSERKAHICAEDDEVLSTNARNDLYMLKVIGDHPDLILFSEHEVIKQKKLRLQGVDRIPARNVVAGDYVDPLT